MTLYDVLNMKGNSIMKSVVLRPFHGDTHANVRIEMEAYDDTFVSAYERKGADYIWQQLENKLKQDGVREKIVKALGLDAFEGALVTLYGDRHSEMYFRSNGINQYNIEW